MAEERTEPDHRPDHVRRGAPPPPEPPPSLERLGRYQLLFELARGGMGRVHVARAVGPHGFGRVLAVKRPLTADASREERAAFLGEARVSARIHHPNVVETLDLGEHDGLPYIAMAFVPGVSLARLLARAADRGERLDPWLVAWIVQEIAAGLDAAHELTGESGEPLGLVHRDVSPENVLLSFEGRVLVTDFGVAKWRRDGAATRADAVKGKLAYMSPEQARGERVDRRTDLLALGIVAHEALTGRRLFAAGSPAETVQRVLDHVPPDLREARPDIPPDLASLVMRCLEKAPSSRPASAAEVAASLRAAFRRERRVLDSSDVAAAVARFFPGEREALARRIAAAERAGSPSPAEPPTGTLAGAPDLSVRAIHTETTDRPPDPAGARAPLRALAGLAAVAAGLAVVFALAGGRTHPAAPQDAAGSSLSPAPGVVSPGSSATSGTGMLPSSAQPLSPADSPSSSSAGLDPSSPVPASTGARSAPPGDSSPAPGDLPSESPHTGPASPGSLGGRDPGSVRGQGGAAAGSGVSSAGSPGLKPPLAGSSVSTSGQTATLPSASPGVAGAVAAPTGRPTKPPSSKGVPFQSLDP
ncbi:MAG: protein kinase [Polyangiaceae bacterium]